MTATAPGTASTATAPATFALSVRQYTPVATSSSRRRPAFVSPQTASISLTLQSVNGTTVSGATTTFAVGPTAPNCSASNGFVNCTLSANLPIGSDVLLASTLDANNKLLGSSQITATVVQNATNDIALAVGGEVASLQIYIDQSSFTPGPATNKLVVVVPLDPSGAEIVNPGNYNPAIAVTMSNSAGGHLSLVTDGSNTGLSATLNSPSDQIAVAYDGIGTSGSANITASAGMGITASTSVNISSPGLSVSPGGTYLQQGVTSFVFTAPGQTGTVNASGGTAPYTITSSDPTVATVSGTSPSFTVTAVGYGTTGTTTLTVTDSASAVHTIPVTFIVPAVTVAVAPCGLGSTCSSGAISFPIPASAPSNAIAPSTVTASGGTGTFTYAFTSSGTTTSTYATVVQSGNTFTVTPNGTGNDALLIISGNQTAYIAITGNLFANSLPHAYGMLVEAVGKSFSVLVPATVTSVTQTTGATDNNLVFTPGSPGTLTATPMTPGPGSFLFTDANGTSVTVPFTLFGLTFLDDPGTGISSPTESSLGSDEQFTAIGQSDTVNVSGNSGALSATSSNTNIVTVAASGSHLTVQSIGSGFATITVTDAGTGGSVTYTVSVTTTTIPIESGPRKP